MSVQIINLNVRQGHTINDPGRRGCRAYVISASTLNPDGEVVVSVSQAMGIKQCRLGPPGKLVTVHTLKDITRSPDEN